MAERRYNVTAGQTIHLQQFFAKQILVNNMLPQWLYVRVGGSDVPTAANCDLAVAPLTEATTPIPTTNIVSIGLGPVIVTLGQQVEANKAIITLYDEPQPGAVGSIDLNPSRMGNVAQQKFVGPASYTIGFPVTTVHVANYSPAWVYIAFGTLVVPTAATADVTLPPMSEKSVTCLPNTQFAFGLSANLVTTGQQIPAGVGVIATFYEYPTPVTIGTADLNPSKLGQMVQKKFTAATSYTLAFVATTVHVANYSPAWVYIAFGTLITPTVATADVALPPMSEKSLTCLPNTQFAFGLSASLVTTGQQVPTGVNVIATFYEYPTPVTIGTASLNPASMGQSSSVSLSASQPIDPAFPVTQVNVANYLQKWIYATYAQTNRLLNPDLESWLAGTPVSWTWSPGGNGTIVQAAGYRYTYSALITKGAVAGVDILYQSFVVTPGEALTLSFWYKSDGANLAQYYVYDNTGAAFIIASTNLTLSTDWTYLRASFVIPAGCVSCRIAVLFPAPRPAGSQIWVDTFCVQVTTTATNAQIAVPPMSEKSISLPPATHLDVVVGTQTVMVATSVPVTQAIVTLYEYYTPVNLGVSSLSPGGFRYQVQVHNAAVVADGDTWQVDLSNFASYRYSAYFTGFRSWIVTVYDSVTATLFPAANTPLGMQNDKKVVIGQAGTRLTFKITLDTTRYGVGGPALLLTDYLEAW